MAELFREENCWTGRPGGLLDSFSIAESIRWRLSSCLRMLNILVRDPTDSGSPILLFAHGATVHPETLGLKENLRQSS